MPCTGDSAGAKFAAWLSRDAAEIGRFPIGLILLDASVGQPPLQQNLVHFPELFGINDEPVARILETLTISSELGTERGHCAWLNVRAKPSNHFLAMN